MATWVNVDEDGVTKQVNMDHVAMVYWHEPTADEPAAELELTFVNGNVLRSTHAGSVQNVIAGISRMMKAES